MKTGSTQPTHSDDPDKAAAIDLANELDETLKSIDRTYKPFVAEKMTQIFDAGGSVQDALTMMRDFIKKVSSMGDQTPEETDIRKRLGIGLREWLEHAAPSETAAADPVSALSVGGESAADVEIRRTMGISPERWRRYNSSSAVSALAAPAPTRAFASPSMLRIETPRWP